MTGTYLRVEVPEATRLRAVAEEGSITDADLDELEDRLLHGGLASAEAGAIALTIGRAGRPKSTWALKSARSRRPLHDHSADAQVLELALDLLQIPPPPRLERADSGYRWTARPGDEPLYVEDPLAAHWHARGRWGPPLRPDPTRSPRVAAAPGPIEPLLAEIDDGGTVLVTFAPPWPWSRPEPPLRLTRAGFSREASLALRVRWSQVASVGTVTRGRDQRVAFEVYGEQRESLPRACSLGVPALVSLMSSLLERSRR